MGLFSNLFGKPNHETQKREKFREFDSQFGQETEMANVSKASWLTSRGNYLGNEGRLDDAIKDFQEAISLKPDFAPAFIGLGVAYREKRLFQKALETLQRTPDRMTVLGRELSTHLFELYQIRASVYLLVENKPKAIEYAKKALTAADDPERLDQLKFAQETGVIDSAQDESEMRYLLQGLIEELGGSISGESDDNQKSGHLEQERKETAETNLAGMFCRLSEESLPQAKGLIKEAKESVDSSVFAGMLGRALIQSAQEGKTAGVLVLLEAGANVNALVEDLTALTVSASAGHEVIVNELLKWGADPNLGRSGLAAAVGRNHISIVSSLLRGGANPNVDIGNGVTPLLAAIIGGKTAIVQQLIRAGADVSMETRSGTMPLLEAVRGGYGGVVQELLDAGVDVGSTNREGVTALAMAAYHDHLDVALVLINAGADVNALTTEGFTALDIAVMEGHADLAQVLHSVGGRSASGR